MPKHSIAYVQEATSDHAISVKRQIEATFQNVITQEPAFLDADSTFRYFWVDKQRGNAQRKRSLLHGIEHEYTIRMPRWLFTNEDIELAYTQAYMLHELAHIYHWLSRGVTTDIHGPEFREFETKLLGYYLDLRPLYNRKHGYAMAFISLQYHVLKFDSCGRSPHSALFELDA